MIFARFLCLLATLFALAARPALAAPDTPVFHVRGADILTPAGERFVARGINLQYGDKPSAALPAIAAIAAVHANIVRLELRQNTSAEEVRAALDAAVANHLPVMAMLWESDITCGHDSRILTQDVRDLWLGRWRDVLLEAKYQPYLMINLANEWGKPDNGFRNYLTTYKGLIGEVRAAGFRVPIVIDAADCGQDASSFLDGRGAAVEAADPLHNLILSVHAYNKPWNSPERIDGHLNDLQATGLPFIIGEFGDRELDEDGGNHVDHLHLMQTASDRGIGWLAWSWKGNGGQTRVLDMSRQYGTADLTRRGQDVSGFLAK